MTNEFDTLDLQAHVRKNVLAFRRRERAKYALVFLAGAWFSILIGATAAAFWAVWNLIR